MSGLTKDQLEMRKTGIGASEVGAVLGLPSFLSPMDVWRNKMGLSVDVDTEDLARGRFLEPAIVAWYEHETGRKTLPVGTLRHPRCPHLLATADRLVPTRAAMQTLEVKAVRGDQRFKWGDSGTDQVPEAYLLQVHAQLIVTDSQVGELAALIGGDDFRLYRFERDIELENMIVEGVEAWWQNYVVTKTPPPVDGSQGWTDYLSQMKRLPKSIAATPEIAALVSQLQEAKAELKGAAEVEKTLRNQLLFAIGDAEAVDGLLTYRMSKGRSKIDWEALAAAKGITKEDIEAFTSRGPGFPSLRLKGASKDD